MTAHTTAHTRQVFNAVCLFCCVCLHTQVYTPDQAVEYFDRMLGQLIRVCSITHINRCGLCVCFEKTEEH
jgi:hypothetical protein